jgi:hypothetical protein
LDRLTHTADWPQVTPTSRIITVTPGATVGGPGFFPTMLGRPSRIVTPPAVISGAGAFALLHPVAHMVETQPPEPGHHIQAAHTNPVAVGTDYLLVLVVILIGAARLVVKLVRVPLDHMR